LGGLVGDSRVEALLELGSFVPADSAEMESVETPELEVIHLAAVAAADAVGFPRGLVQHREYSE
jgi:hypothetical protein